MKPGRLSCIVPYCRCTVAQDRHPEATEVICAKHWRPVSKATKARYRQVKRRKELVWKRMCNSRALRRRGRTPTPDLWEAVRDAVPQTWERCKREAIEIAMGITA